MDIQISYHEVLTMLYLSQLIYDYHTNEYFNLDSNESISTYIKMVNIKYDDGLDNEIFKYIKEALLYLNMNFPDCKLLTYIDNKETDTNLAILVDDIKKNIVITFRGTESITDCYYDLVFTKQNINNVDNLKVHKGFYEQLMSVYDEILSKLEQLLNYNNEYNIYITGHSLGSGIGTIFAYLLQDIYPNKLIKLITFGGPRVGNYTFKQNFENKKNIIHYRITNNRDIVTAVPFINYYHVGLNIHLESDSIFIIPYNTYSTYWYGSLFHSFNVCNHKLEYYHTNLINKENQWNELEDSFFYSEVEVLTEYDSDNDNKGLCC